MKEKSKKSSFVGFTLVELVIVIAVIAILAAVLIPTFGSVISSANNSADLQLVKNMNTVLSTNLDEDVAATADNIRKYLSDNGLDKLATKNKDMVIVYNKESKQFERMNLSKTIKSGAIELVHAAGPSKVINNAAYSPEEIFKGNVIVSTQGNKLAEALYSLHTFSAPSGFDAGEFIESVFAKIDNDEVAGAVANVINSTAFITDDGKGGTAVQTFPLVNEGGKWVYSKEKTLNADRVIFNDELKSVDLNVLTSSDIDFSGAIIIPNSIEEIKLPSDISDLSGVNFVGNVEVFDEQIKDDPEFAELVIEGSIENYKEGVEKFGGELLAQSTFYVKTEGADSAKFEYASISAAISQAENSAFYTGKEKTVVLTDTKTVLNEDISIPNNVTLSIPYKYDSAENMYSLGVGYDISGKNCKQSIVDDDLKSQNNYANKSAAYLTHELVINESKTITIEKGGKLVVGAITSYPGQYYNGHTSGNYAKITNNGNIIVNDGGQLECYGYIKNGKVEATKGGKIIEPFIVTDFTGGGNTISLYFGHQSPFLRYAMLNIQSDLTINYGALLYAHCNLYAGSMYNTTNEVVIGYGTTTANTKGLITLEDEGSFVVCKYEKGNYVYDKTGGNNLKGDIGKTTVTIYGNARTESLSLMGLADTKDVIFPVPFNFDYVIAGGNFEIKNQYVILPGASVTVNSGATLTVTSGASFYVMDYLNPTGSGATMNGKSYPTNAMLGDATLQSSGIFTVKGTFVVENGTPKQKTKVGGIIRAAETGSLIIGTEAGNTINGENIDTSGAFPIGGEAMYNTNTATFRFPLRVFDVDSVNMADYTVDNNLKLANVSVSSKYTAQSAASQNISETTTYSAYEVYKADNAKHTGKEQIVAAGGTYVDVEGTSTVTFEATYGFEQTIGAEAQVTTFKEGNYNYSESKTFEQAVAAIDAYYALSPKARQEVGNGDGGFDIETYSEDVVSGLFKKVEAYAAAFEAGDKSAVVVALAGITAANAVDALSDNVKRLLSEDITGLRAALNNDKEKMLIFSVSYSSADAGKFTSEFTQERPENKIEKDGTTTIYYMASQATDLGKTIIDDNGTSHGTTDPYGTLFYEAWKKYVGNAQSGANKVTFTLYTDIKLLQTESFTLNGKYPTNYSEWLNVSENKNVDFNLNGHNLTFLIYGSIIGNSAFIYNGRGVINNSGTLKICNGNILFKSLNNQFNNSSNDAYVISSSGNLTAENLTITCYELFNNFIVLVDMNGIRIHGDNSKAMLSGVKILGRSKYAGSVYTPKVSNQTNSYDYELYSGVAIDGGEAELNKVNMIDLQIGIIITKTNNTGVKIVDSNITTGRGALIAGSANTNATINISEIRGCLFSVSSSYANGSRPITIDGSQMASITIGSITDCKFLGMFNSIQIKGTASEGINNVKVGSITNCSIIADDLTAGSSGSSAAPVALELVSGVTISSMSNTTIAAIDNQGSTKAVAVSVGNGCMLNMVLSDEVNNYFSVSGKDDSQPFDIKSGSSVTLTINNGEPTAFDLETNLTSEPEMHNGYSCRKLQSGN